MDAFILIAPGDEGYAAEIAAKIAPASSIEAPLAAASGLAFGEQLFVLPIWSARGEAAGLGPQLLDISRRLGDRCIIVRADGTPLPPIATSAQIVVLGRDNELSAMLKVARMRTRAAAAPAPVRRSYHMSNVAPGVGVGLAIYAGMFVAAGAWRSDEIVQTLDTEKQAPAVLALRSFQTAFDAPETAHVSLAASTPDARFVTPQRVIVTASIDSSTLPVIATDPAAPEPLVRVDDTVAPMQVRPTQEVDTTPLPVLDLTDAGGAGSLSLISLDGVSTIDFAGNDVL